MKHRIALLIALLLALLTAVGVWFAMQSKANKPVERIPDFYDAPIMDGYRVCAAYQSGENIFEIFS